MDVDLTQETDAMVWTKEFTRICKEKGFQLDEGWMLGWFSNAIMAGWDARARKTQEKQ